MDEIIQNPEYEILLERLKQEIHCSRLKASLAVSKELIELYWYIGKQIDQSQKAQGWGKRVVEHLSYDLKEAYPNTTGFSPRNLWRMRAFYLHYNQKDTNLSQVVAELESEGLRLSKAETLEEKVLGLLSRLPWGQNIVLFEKIKDLRLSFWYGAHAVFYGWSRDMLALHVGSNLHKRQGQAPNNFKLTLPDVDSDLAQQVLKDPYNFDFLELTGDDQERQLENKLVGDIEKFLLELGMGFAFIGRQYRLEVEGEEYFIDLLFYHLKLRCFIIIDLKMKPFVPEFAGKMQFYTSAVDDLLRHETDNPSIGLILCKSHQKTKVEYTLKDTKKPIGVASFYTQGELPDELQGNLPKPEQLAWVIERAEKEAENVDNSEA